jgi:hypothetical protein
MGLRFVVGGLTRRKRRAEYPLRGTSRVNRAEKHNANHLIALETPSWD